MRTKDLHCLESCRQGSKWVIDGILNSCHDGINAALNYEGIQLLNGNTPNPQVTDDLKSKQKQLAIN